MPAGYVPFNDLPWSSHVMVVERAGRGGRILELGCSSGYVTERFVRNGNTVVGVDGDPQAAKEAEAFCERVEVGDLETMDLPGTPGEFDAVILADVLEHLRDPRALLRRVRPLVRDGGRVVVSTPNVANFSIRARLLVGIWRYSDRGLMDRTHLHFFTRATLLEALRETGWHPVEVEASVPSVVRTRGLRRAAHAVAKAWPGMFAHQLVITAEAR